MPSSSAYRQERSEVEEEVLGVSEIKSKKNVKKNGTMYDREKRTKI